jgi:serine-type D-Ala-D-Ala carboxypeptidase/endopeptidase (penicillin-binding protein 4)
MKIRRLSLVLASIVAGCSMGRPSTEPQASGSSGVRGMLARTIDSMIASPEFRTTHWGVLIFDPARGETLYKHNAAKLFIPASNQKMVVSSVALQQLGPEYRFKTIIGARGAIAEQTLNGDLAVMGRGDPTASERVRGDAMTPLREIADSLWQRGIRRIVGNVVAHGNAFPGPVAGSGWPWDQLDATSFAGVDELLFNEGLFSLRVRAGARVGDPAVIESRPAKTYPTVRNMTVTIARDPSAAAPTTGRGGGRGGRGGARVAAYYDTLTTNIVVRGQIAEGDSANITIAQHDPNTAYVTALTQALRERGIMVDQQPVNGDARIDSLFTLQSVPLRDILPALMKPSQNQIAEAFLRILGLERAGVGTADSGRRVIERQFTEWKIPTDAYVVRDGSGLSRSDLISPEAIIGILEAMRKSPHFDLYRESLPIAGVDGTIRTRMKGTPAEGNLRAKTGTLSMVRSLSGYVTTADKQLLEFSILCNNWTAPQAAVDKVADAIGVMLASMTLR